MAAAKAEKPEGILTKPTSERYQVKFPVKGETRYGTVRRIYSFSKGPEEKLLLDAAARGELIVDDAVLSKAWRVKESDVTDVPLGHFDENDEFHNHIGKLYKAAQERSDKLGDGVKVGKLFSIGVADGMAVYEVTRVKGSKCDVEWRGYGGGDRYIDHYFGWGRKSIAVSDVERYVGRTEGMRKLFAKKS